jgi:hypothetical protein
MRDSITVHTMVKYHLPCSNPKDTSLLCQIFAAPPLSNPIVILPHQSANFLRCHDSSESRNYLLVKWTFQPELSIEPNCHAIAPSGRIAAATNLSGEKISGNPQSNDKCLCLEAGRGGGLSGIGAIFENRL